MIKKIFFYTIVLIFTQSCGNEVDSDLEVIRPVKYVRIGEIQNDLTRTYSGTVKANNEIELSFRSSGVITELNVKVGSEVKKGDLIARLDNVQASLAYDQAKNSLNSALSLLNTSESQLNRVKNLYEKGSSSLSDYEKAKNAYQSSLDQYNSSKKNVSLKSSQIKYGYIYAPKNGVITSKLASLNELANPGQKIVVMNAGNEMIVETGVSESIINEIDLGMHVQILFPSLKSHAYKGLVTEISPLLLKGSGTYNVKIFIENFNDSIKQGMTASVGFNLNDEHSGDDQIYVPINTVGEDGEGNFVFVIKDESEGVGIVKRTYIEVGQMSDAGFEVLTGLNKGELVVTAGINSLLDGQKVKL